MKRLTIILFVMTLISCADEKSPKENPPTGTIVALPNCTNELTFKIIEKGQTSWSVYVRGFNSKEQCNWMRLIYTSVKIHNKFGGYQFTFYDQTNIQYDEYGNYLESNNKHKIGFVRLLESEINLNFFKHFNRQKKNFLNKNIIIENTTYNWINDEEERINSTDIRWKGEKKFEKTQTSSDTLDVGNVIK